MRQFGKCGFRVSRILVCHKEAGIAKEKGTSRNKNKLRGNEMAGCGETANRRGKRGRGEGRGRRKEEKESADEPAG